MTFKARIADFIEGRANGREFVEEMTKDSEMLDWIQSNMPLKRCSCKKSSLYESKLDFWPGDAFPFDIRIELDNIKGRDGRFSLGEIIEVHRLLCSCYFESFPSEKLIIGEELEKEFDFIMSHTPIYIGGNGVDIILERIYESIPKGLSQKDAARQFREACNECFHVIGRRYPRWVQCAQWPIDQDGNPLRFLRQRRDDDENVTYYVFMSLQNETETVISQTS